MSFRSLVPIQLRKKVKSLFIFFFRNISSSVIADDFKFNKKGRIIFIFSAISYSFRDQRPQKIARYLAQKHTVFYVNNEFITTKNFINPPFIIKKIDNNIYEFTLSSFWSYFIYTDIVGSFGKNVIERSFFNFIFINKLRLASCIFIYHHPFWAQFSFHEMTSHKIYDCFDDHSSFKISNINMLHFEKKLFSSCKTIASSFYLASKAHTSTIIPNGTDFSLFNKAIDKNKISMETIGYIGAIEEWLDVELIQQILIKYPHKKLVFVGKVNNKKLTDLCNMYRNLFTLGEVPYNDIPQILNTFKVCLIPFHSSNLISATDPIKFYEYISMGKAVVTTGIPSLLPFKSICYYSHNHNDFLKNLDKALAENDNKMVLERIKVAKTRDWKLIGSKFLKEIT